jgi:hypothetical protein
MSDLADDPEYRLTLRQGAQARDDFATILDELDREDAALSPTRSSMALADVARLQRRMGAARSYRIAAGAVSRSG